MCPDDTVLVRLLDGGLNGDERARVEAHLDECSACRRVVSALAMSSLASPMQESPTPSFAWSETAHSPLAHTGSATGSVTPRAPGEKRVDVDAVLPRGASVDRYLVLGILGVGGMGVVYAAHDPDLDRKVALKFVRPEMLGTRGNRRLLREAQSLARLSHPNVVSVFDVGTHGDAVFIAMEHIEGTALDAWLRAERRKWRAILSAFLAAGRGLAAAHAVDLVHRDFKPSNVLVRADGSVKVADFGLSRVLAHGPKTDSEAAAPDLRGAAPLTLVGGVVGTPAYMAPEQRRGEVADARSDQFAFCLALHEAMTGERQAASPDAGLSAPPAPTERPPRAILRALERGLATRPEDRHASMDVLLSALVRASNARRRWLGAAAAVVLAGGVVLWWRLAEDRAAPCRAQAARAASLWDAGRRERVERAFRATRATFAAATFQTTDHLASAFASAWRAQHEAACDATWKRRVQSPELLDLRMECLSGRFRAADALFRLFEAADATLVARAPSTVGDLPPLAACEDVAALREPIRAPTAASAREEIRSSRARLAEARALLIAGRYAEARDAAREVVSSARALQARALEAEALLTQGEALSKTAQTDDAFPVLQGAVWAAEASRDRAVLVRAATALVSLLEYRRGDLRLADDWSHFARAALEGHGASDDLERAVFTAQGGLAHTAGRYEEALASYERVLAAAARGGTRTLAYAGALDRVALALWPLGRYAEAIERARAALALKGELLGTEHPDLATDLNNLGLSLWKQSRAAEGIPLLERALEIRRKNLGETHPDVALVLQNLGLSLRAVGREREAAQAYRRAIAIYERTSGPEHPSVAHPLGNLGRLLRESGQFAEARTVLERSLGIRTKSLGAEHPLLAYPLHNLGEIARAEGKLDEAARLHSRALAIRRHAYPKGHPEIADSLAYVGGVHASARRFDRAMAVFEEAERLGAAQRAPRLPEIQAMLAHVMWEAKRPRSEVLAAIDRAEHSAMRKGEAARTALEAALRWAREAGLR